MQIHRNFADALTEWRQLGGAMLFHQASARDEPSGWQVWLSLDDLEDVIDRTAREATAEALRQGGMTEEQIKVEMADWWDKDSPPMCSPGASDT